ncbi:hypothetical protein BKA69DRAFT_1091130 [Paraphysoderma sedebokerense]|nr:hypothetical protein BKA69DRAFT_1091130 [Paraphysoderma sedebokerense]
MTTPDYPPSVYPESDKNNLLTNVLRSVTLGATAINFIVALIIYLKKHDVNALVTVICNFLICITMALCVVWDSELLPDCLFRVKLIYTLITLGFLCCVFVQVRKCYIMYRSHKFIRQICAGLCLLRFIPYIVNLAHYTYGYKQHRCLTVLPVAINTFDRSLQLVFNFLVTGAFIYRIFSQTIANVKSGVRSSIFEKYIAIVKNESFILMLSMVADTIYIVILFTLAGTVDLSLLNAFYICVDPTILTLWLMTNFARSARFEADGNSNNSVGSNNQASSLNANSIKATTTQVKSIESSGAARQPSRSSAAI